MPPPRDERQPSPASFLAAGQSWPGGRLRDDHPLYAEWARQAAQRVTETLAERRISLRAAGKMLGIPHSTLSRVLAGKVVPDLRTLGELEVRLGVELLPRRDT